MNAQPSSLGLFEYLDASHRSIDTQVRRLKELVSSLDRRDLTVDERKELHGLCQFFESEARQHHQDEERHIFPALLASTKEEIVQTARRLTQDHGWLEENWLEIYPHLEALSQDSGSWDFAELTHAVDVFSALYAEHMELEESLAYPEARKLTLPKEAFGAGREMAQRRYAKQPLA